jgi:hypothetical protein
MTGPRRVQLTVAALAAASAAACGNGGSTPAASGSTAPSAPQTSASTVPTAAATTTAPAASHDACLVVTKADVAAATGHAVLTVSHEGINCGFSLAGGGDVHMKYESETLADEKAGIEAGFKTTTTAVSGIGDGAFSYHATIFGIPTAGMIAVRGRWAANVAISGAGSAPAQVEPLVKKLIAAV